jgi:AraC-like DNA-binding protein
MGREPDYFFSLEGPLDVGPSAGQMRAGNLSGFHALVQRYGADPRRMLERHDIDPTAFADPDNFIACTAAVGALEDCRARFDAPLFGLELAELQGPDVFGCVAALGRAAPTFREGLQGIVDYLPVTHSREGELEIVATRDTAELRWRGHGDFATIEQANYQALLLNLKILQMLGGAEFRPTYVDLALNVPARELEEIQARFGCRVSGRRDGNAIGFSSGVLDRPVGTANRLLFSLLGSYLKRVKAASAATTVERVESYIRGALPSGACTIARCARKLGASVRTLQLRLSESGVKFSDLVEKQRIEQATSALRGGQASVHEVAAMLGYSEQASFGRAFKRWTGMTPRAYRGAA